MADTKRPAPDPIGDAIDRIAAAAHNRTAVRIPVLDVPHSWPDDADVVVQAPEDPAAPLLLIWDAAEQAWRAIVLPPGSRWQIRPEGAQLWQPGRPS